MRIPGNTPEEKLRWLIDNRWDGSQKSLAEAVNMTEASLSRLVNGVHELRKSRFLEPLAERLGVRYQEIIGTHDPGGAPSDPTAGSGGYLTEALAQVRERANPDPEGSPAEQLLHMLGMRAGMRRVARELTDKDLITVAYTIARADGWKREEFQKLDAWRDAILEEEQERGS